MVNEFYNKHYIIIRDDSAIVDAWSDGPRSYNDTSNAICINERGGYQFRFTPDGEENPNIYDFEGIPLYKWDGKCVIPRTAEEIAEEKTAMLKSPERRAAEIKQQLITLDFQTTRPLRAIAAGTSSDEDRDRLREIETQVAALRAELAELEMQ